MLCVSIKINFGSDTNISCANLILVHISPLRYELSFDDTEVYLALGICWWVACISCYANERLTRRTFHTALHLRSVMRQVAKETKFQCQLKRLFDTNTGDTETFGG